jgi:hypothetical protein
MKKAHEQVHHRSAETIRHSLRDGLRLTPRSPRRSGFLVTVIGAMDEHRRRLDISVGMSGPRGFAVRLMRVRLAAPKRPPHPAPNVRDDRETPLW